MGYEKLKASDARKIALDGFKVTTLYRNQFPYNCGLKQNGVIFGDCWCMFPKVLIWSHAVGLNPFLNRKEGTYFYNGENGSYNGIGASGLGDWDGDTIMNTCTDVRRDFTRKDVGELMLIKGHHMAMYIGDFSLGDGKAYNSVEFNYYNDDYDGLIPFWTDDWGNRFFWRNGPATGGTFDLIGKLTTWMDYTKEPDPDPKHIDEDGDWGIKTTKLAQRVYGCKTVNGYVVHQKKSYKKVCPACSEDSWRFDGTSGYSPLILRIQKELGINYPKISASYGRMTIKTRKKLQKMLGTKVDGTIKKADVVAFQKLMNKRAKKLK